MKAAKQLNIAVVGSGISGLSCAWLLHQHHRVTLFEKENRFGGHSNTVQVNHQGQEIAVDTGFIVFNPNSYPNLVALFDHLQVPILDTEMSFSVSVDQGRLEYSGTDLNGLFAQRRNLINPSFWRMLLDIRRFYQASEQALTDLPDNLSLGELIQQWGLSNQFRDEHLLPMGAAIWSTPRDKMLSFPAKSFLRFCDNHGLLQMTNRPQWQTVSGGSRVYVDKLLAALGTDTLAHVGASRIKRQIIDGEPQVIVTDEKGQTHRFDHVVMASHADQTLALLEDADVQEHYLLSPFQYEPNRTLLHSDPRLMPVRRRAWSSWNYLQQDDGQQLSVSYWMNRLQQLPDALPLFVTLNPYCEPRPETVHAEFLYDHPVFDQTALYAQRKLWSLQGQRNTWFCGAWFGYGSHEDGLQSGLAVAESLGGVSRPWQVPRMYDRLQLPSDWRKHSPSWEAA